LLKAPACEGCNIAKENRLPIEWAVYSASKGLDFATIPIGAEYMQTEVEEKRESLYVEIAQLVDNLIDEMEQEYVA
jgi:hypothetical protein